MTDNLDVKSFNPRPHTAGDKQSQRLTCGKKSFNPRPHTAGDM